MYMRIIWWTLMGISYIYVNLGNGNLYNTEPTSHSTVYYSIYLRHL